MNDWVKEIKDNTDLDVIIYLVGNRADLEDQREVKPNEGVELTKEMEFNNFMETSALTG